MVCRVLLGSLCGVQCVLDALSWCCRCPPGARTWPASVARGASRAPRGLRRRSRGLRISRGLRGSRGVDVGLSGRPTPRVPVLTDLTTRLTEG